MNAPLPAIRLRSPVRLQEVLEDILVDLNTAKDSLFSPRATPLEEDILQEEAVANFNRTATPMQVLETLLLADSSKRKVSAQEFSNWLSENEWPEEQCQKTEGGEPGLVKVFKGVTGFGVKTIPIRPGGFLDGVNASYAIHTWRKG